MPVLLNEMRHAMHAIPLAFVLGIFLSPDCLLAHGDLDARISEVSRRIQSTPTNVSLLLERAELHREHQDWSSANADLDRAHRLVPNHLAYELIRARVFRDQALWRESVESYDRFIQAITNNSQVRIERARVFAQLGRTNDAILDYNIAIAGAEPQPEYFLERANLLAGDRNLDQAIAGIDEGITKLGNIISLERRAIEFEIARTNTDGAVKRLDAICRRMARPETWLAEKGDLLLKSGRQAEAQAAYSEALAAIAKRPARLKSTESVKSLQTRIESALKTE